MPSLGSDLDWTAILLSVNSFLIGVVLILGGYIWRKALVDLEEFRRQNREEHAEFLKEIGSVQRDIAYIKGKADGVGGKKS